jgi:hypothetical protein
VAPRPAALPRRPLTVGELLDAAAQLVRGPVLILLPLALVFAVGEQAVLLPLREALGVGFRGGFRGDFGTWAAAWWSATALGMGLEAFIITALGPWAGRAMAADLTGQPLAVGGLIRPRVKEIAAVLVAAPIAGLSSAVGALLFFIFWVPGYALFGLAGAVAGMERRGPFGALGRAVRFAFRGGMRATRVRLLGYLAWLILRLGFFAGVSALLSLFPLTATAHFWLVTAGFVIANTAAYTFLAALDAATLAEARFRSEALDVWLSRAETHGALTPEVLAATR